MAYAAVISLKQTLTRLAVSIAPPSLETLLHAYEEVESLQDYHQTVKLLASPMEVLKSLQETLRRLDDGNISRRSASCKISLNTLDGEIREAAHELQDVLEFNESDRFLSQCPWSFPHALCLDLQEIRQEIDSFIETVQKMEEMYIKELECKPLSDDEEDEDVSSSRIHDIGVKDMVGLSYEFSDIKSHMLKRVRPYDFGVYSFFGKEGSCRTYTARAVFVHLCLWKEQSFDCGAWVHVGANYECKKLVLAILALIDSSNAGKGFEGEDEQDMMDYLYSCLKGRKYMIVLDDVRDIQIGELLKRAFPKQIDGSLVLITTGVQEITDLDDSFYMPVLDEEFSWDMLRMAMFGLKPCPAELEEAGKKIAKNCEGLRLPLVKVILHLWKAEKTPEYWNKFAENKDNSIFIVTDELSELGKITEDIELYDSFMENDERTLAIELAKRVLDLTDQISAIKMHLFPERLVPKMEIISIVGTAGIGKTAIAKKVFEDPSILHRFDCLAWVTLGPKYRTEDILVDILAQMYPTIDKKHLKEDEKLAKDLCSQLSDKICLIVLDDVWDIEPLHNLKKLLPDIKGEVLVTTRQLKVVQLGLFDKILRMRLLTKEESWNLFCQKVFDQEVCPHELEEAGKLISENCEGLPLLILTIAGLLSKAEKTRKYWNKAAEKQSSVFMEAHDMVSKVLFPSYEYLAQHLKACFLYMGVFPQNYEISCSKLIKLWTVEGILEPNPSQTAEEFASECLSELVDKHLVMVHQKASNSRIKNFRLHSTFWHLCNNEAVKNKFFHALNTCADTSIEGTESGRRVCIRNNILLSIKDVHSSISSMSAARSLLCTGSTHRYPVPICLDSRLLKVVDALTIRLYEFPIEVVKLIHLKYLALSCNGKLPTSISELWILQYLIVSQHLSITSFEDSSRLPVEIWDMKELKHLQIMGRQLPSPNQNALLPNLSTLLEVSAHSCSKEILESMPNLKRLGIRIELAPDDDGELFQNLNNISCLTSLESLKCVVVNPGIKFEVVAPPPPVSMFPSGLKKLSLSGLGYPWEYMSIIAQLSTLEVLKLRYYAFQGPAWDADHIVFEKLKFLSIEDTDLVQWKLSLGSFGKLEYLSIKNCYKLEELPKQNLFLDTIEIFDCNPLAVRWAKQMEHMWRPVTSKPIKIQVYSSWDVLRTS